MKVGDIVEITEGHCPADLMRWPRFLRICKTEAGFIWVERMDTRERSIGWIKERFKPADPLVAALMEANSK